MSPLQRSKQHLEELGYRVAIVEKWNMWKKVRQDLFGVADLLAMRHGDPLVAVQVTTTGHLSNRTGKDPEMVACWISTGNRFEYHGWSKKGARGKRKLWTLTRRFLQVKPR